jgi:hypothetical protein
LLQTAAVVIVSWFYKLDGIESKGIKNKPKHTFFQRFGNGPQIEAALASTA